MTISELMTNIARVLGCEFQVYGSDVPSEKVFDEQGLLPAFSKRAERLSLFVLQKPLGLSFVKNTAAMGGVIVKFDDTVPNSYRLLCLVDVLIELIHESPSKKQIKLDSLLYD